MTGTADPIVVGIAPGGRTVPSALVVSTSPGDVARHAVGRLQLGCAVLFSVAAPLERDAQLARSRQNEAAMRLLGVQCVRLAVGRTRAEGMQTDPGAIDDAELERMRERLTALLEGVDEVWLPAAVADTPRETAVRDAGAACAVAAGARIVLFAPAGTDAAEVERRAAPLERVVGRHALEQQTFRLDEQAATAKRVVLDQYRDAVAGPDTPLDVEHSWRVRAAAGV